MRQILVIAPFKFAHHGYQVEEFEPSADVRETTDECAQIAVAEGWATLVESVEGAGTGVALPLINHAPDPASAKRPAEQPEVPAEQSEQQADPAAPENKDAAPQRSAKAAA